MEILRDLLQDSIDIWRAKYPRIGIFFGPFVSGLFGFGPSVIHQIPSTIPSFSFHENPRINSSIQADGIIIFESKLSLST
jgi:hypothetical protein